MRRTSLFLATALALTVATSSHAYTFGPWGCNLRWDHCYGDGGVQNKSFACDSNTGSNVLIASFVPAWDIANVSGIETVLNLATASPSLPAWWQFKNAGSCRTTSLAVTAIPVDAPETTLCPNWGQGFEAGGIAAYNIGFFGPNGARMIIAFAVPADGIAFLNGRKEYFAYRITINHANTIGTGACAGCTTPCCLTLNSVFMSTVPGLNPSRYLTGPANQVDSDFALWQGGAGVSTQLGTGCPAATPTRHSTWGEVKSLYR